MLKRKRTKCTAYSDVIRLEPRFRLFEREDFVGNMANELDREATEETCFPPLMKGFYDILR